MAGRVHVADPEPPAAPYWKLSADPQFTDKNRDDVGLYMAPPENAPALYADGKSQFHAYPGAGPGRPILPTLPTARPG